MSNSSFEGLTPGTKPENIPLIHTGAIKDTLTPPSIAKAQASAVYASEADLLNVAPFGQTANLESLKSFLILLAQARASDSLGVS